MSVSSGAKVYALEQGVSIREKLFDIVVNISPTETLFLNQFSKEPTGNLKFEWTKDTTSGFTSNSHYDGEDYSFSTPAPRSRLENYAQFFITTFKTGDLINRADQAGVDNEYAYQQRKATKSHALAMEYAIIYETSAGVSASAATKTRGIDSWIETYSATGSASAEFTSTAFQNLLRQVVTKGDCNPTWCVLSPILKQQAANFTTPATQYINVEDKRLIASINVFESSFGVVTFEYCNWLSADNSPSDNYGRAYILDRSKWSLAVYAETWSKEVPIAAAAKAGALHTCLGVKCLAEAANAKYLASNC